jgi:hypothetical protein
LQALQRIEALTVALHRKGIRNPGPNEQLAYVLQNQLSMEEVPRWTSLANADGTISDATLNELELHSTPTTTSRHSCLPETREAFFARRVDHLRNFLRDQSKATTGGRQTGSTPARPGAYARAALASGETTNEDEHVAPPPPPASGTSTTFRRSTTGAQTLWNAGCVSRGQNPTPGQPGRSPTRSTSAQPAARGRQQGRVPSTVAFGPVLREGAQRATMPS